MNIIPLRNSLAIHALTLLSLVLTSCGTWGGAQETLSSNASSMSENTSTGQLTFDPSDLTFTLNDDVDVKKVTFKTRYGIEIVGDLYTPKNMGDTPMQAIAISGPFGAVKEQSSGLYANELASRGFVALAFDPSYTGESGGDLRNIASSDVYTEDFSAAVDYLGSLDFVDREKIGILGICGLGGFALNAASTDTRIQAVATSTMYDIPRVNANGYDDVNTDADRIALIEQASQARWNMADGLPEQGMPGGIMTQEQIDSLPTPILQMYMQYYRTERGFHKRSVNSNGNWHPTNVAALINAPILNRINYISPRPILIVAGEKAHSLYFSEDAYKMAPEPKELYIVPNAIHTDLYDGGDNNYIPFDTFESFFKENL